MAKGGGQNNRIYFIKSGRRIKIGVSSDLKGRLAEIGKHLVTKPTLLGSVASKRAYALEKHIHTVLLAHWIRNEWFHDHPTVREAMAKVLAFDELGYKPTDYQKKKTAFVPRERTFEDWLRSIQYISGLIWPDHPAAGLAKASEISISDAEAYLSGTLDMPRPIACVLAMELTERIHADIRQAREKKNV